MAAPSKDQYIVWMDLEMTGLDPERERIIEIATVITDGNLNTIKEGPDLVIHQPDEVLAAMDEWNTSHHGASGLTDRVRRSRISETEAEEQTLSFAPRIIAVGAVLIVLLPWTIRVAGSFTVRMLEMVAKASL